MGREPPTGVIQATASLETVLALVKLQNCGLEVYLPVKVTALLNEQVMLLASISIHA